MIQLFDYQNDLMGEVYGSLLKKNKRIVVVAPCRSGKTVIFAKICQSAEAKGNRTLILTHRNHLVEQDTQTLRNFSVNNGVVSAGILFAPKNDVCVGMVKTIESKLKKAAPGWLAWFQSFDIVILDECHLKDLYILHSYLLEKTILLGFTGSPCPDSFLLSDFFTDMVQSIQPFDLVNYGRLVPMQLIRLTVDTSLLKKSGSDFNKKDTISFYSNRIRLETVFNAWIENAKDLQTIIYCNSIQNSIEAFDYWTANGFLCVRVDSKEKELNEPSTKQAIELYQTKQVQILINVDICVAGFDSPITECIILNFATLSKAKFIQAGLRGSGTNGIKKRVVCIDAGGNSERHGHPMQDRNWFLYPQKNKGEGVAPMKECPICFHLVHASVMLCPHCGHVWIPTEKEEVTVRVDHIIDYVREGVHPMWFNESLEEIEKIRIKNGYPITWVTNQFTYLDQFKAYGVILGKAPEWALKFYHVKEQLKKEKKYN